MAVAAGILSWSGLTALAVGVGISQEIGWLFPLAVDGSMLAGSLAVLHATLKAERATFPWAVVAIGAALSVYGNVRSGTGTVDSALVHGSIPVLLLLSVEMLFRLLRHRIETDVAASAAAEVAEVAAAEKAARKAARERRAAARPTVAPKPVPPSTDRGVAPLALVSETDRSALRERALELRAAGHSYGRIAGEIGVPVSTVKRWAAAAA